MALRRFNRGGKEQKALTEEQEQDINEAFDLVDANGSGSVNSEVAIRWLGLGLKVAIQAQGLESKNGDIQKLISNDHDDSGSGNDESDSKQITVHRLSGEPITLSFSPDWTVMQLKRALHDRGSFAPILQKICIGTASLDVHEKLADHLKPHETLSVTMVVSLDEINRQLQSTSAHSRAKALTIISSNFSRSNVGDTMVASVRLCLSDPSAHVRRAALKALWKIVGRGDEHVIVEVTACLHDEAGYVRESALFALGHMLPAGDERFQAAVEACLHDAEAQVRCSALHEIEEIMKEHDGTQHKGKVAQGWHALVEALLCGSSP